MAAASGKLGQKLIAIADTWVIDPFRPNLQLQTFLKSLATHPRLTPQAVNATRALRDNAMQKRVRYSHSLMLVCLPHLGISVVSSFEEDATTRFDAVAL